MEVVGVEARKRSLTYDWERISTPDDLRIIRLKESDERRLAWSAVISVLDCELLPLEPDIVAVPGWSGVAAIATLAWAAHHGIPALVMSESNSHDFRRSQFMESIKRYFIRSFAAGLVGGPGQKAYLIELGLSADAISLGYDAVDNAYFANGADAVRQREIMPGNCKLGCEYFRRFFLTVARMVQKKNLVRLVEAYARYVADSRTGEPWPLVILGAGPTRPEIESCIAQHNLSSTVTLPGFEQYDVLPKWYGAAGCFVLASIREQWGLVVNEAMASGLPVLVSRRCGCSSTLVHEGVNGWTFDPFDIDRIASAMARVANAGESERAALGDASKRIVADWGVERFAEGLETAARSAIATGSRPIGLTKRIALGAIAALQERRSVSGTE
jgi:glycosyltransferase involved in cell wall biosynthesis